MPTYAFARRLNGQAVTGIVDIETQKVLCYCNARNAQIILDALNANGSKILSVAPRKDPYVDEVMPGRLANALADFVGIRFPKLSECPHVSELIGRRPLGPVSIEDYKEVMRKYNFHNKVD